MSYTIANCMGRIDLAVPYAEKDMVKNLGGRWDLQKKVWFVPDRVDPTPFRRWLPREVSANLSSSVPTPRGGGKRIVRLDPTLPENLLTKRSIQSTAETNPRFWVEGRLPLLVPDGSVVPKLVAAGAETSQGAVFIRYGAAIDFAALHDFLPFVAQNAIVPRMGDLIPRTSWGSNLNNLLTRSCWNQFRKRTFSLTAYRCEICGSPEKLECHEVWEYHDPLPDAQPDTCGVQRLVRLMALCDLCHETYHLGLANVKRRLHIAGERVRAYNRWKPSEIGEYMNLIMFRWQQRNQCSWVLDLSCVNGLPLIVEGKWGLQDDGFLRGRTRMGQSQTLILGAAWEHAGVSHPALPPDVGYCE